MSNEEADDEARARAVIAHVMLENFRERGVGTFATSCSLDGTIVGQLRCAEGHEFHGYAVPGEYEEDEAFADALAVVRRATRPCCRDLKVAKFSPYYW